MKTTAGLWIDPREAIVITLSDKGENTRQILSNVEKQHGRIDGKRSVAPFDSQLMVADDVQQKEFTGHLNVFYDEVVGAIHDAESILLFGPGEAKFELKKRLANKKLDGRVVSVETADKMTVPQIAAKVRRYFVGKTDAVMKP